MTGVFLRFSCSCSCSCSNLAHSVPDLPGGCDSVARAFQPEICPAAIGLRAVYLTRSREGAKEVAKGGGRWRFSSTSTSTVRQGGLSTSTMGGLCGIMFLGFSCSCSNFARWLFSVARAFQPEHFLRHTSAWRCGSAGASPSRWHALAERQGPFG